MASSPHRIRRLCWKVSAGSPADAFAIRGYLHEQCQDLLLAAFEKAFDEVANGERVIHIPKLEFHLQVASEKQLTEMLPDLLDQQLRERLRTMQEGFQPSEPAVSWKESSAAQNRFEILLHYLRTGSMPWQATYAPAAEIASEFKETCRRQGPQILACLRAKDETAHFYFRLFQLIADEAASITLVSELCGSLPHAWRSATIACVTWLLGSDQRPLQRYSQRQLAAAILSECLRQRESSIAPELTSILEGASLPEARPLNDVIASLPAAVAVLFRRTKRIDGEAAADGVGGLNREVNKGMKKVGSSTDTADPSSLYTDPGNVYQEVRQTPFSLAGEDAAHDKSAEDTFPLAVNHAGLVLVHPFVTRLFENTGIKEHDNPRLSPFAIAHAAALLHFMATGREDVYEYELGFIKILLGLSPETSLPVSEGLIEPGDREESEALLQSVIGYWSALKNTSADGLRNSFLQRPALLREHGIGWKLQVEGKPYDVLLDRLPWSISVVKLPWMNKTVYAEWGMR